MTVKHRAGLGKRLTDTDLAIIGLLRLDSRRTVSEIAARIGVSRTTVKDRIDLLRERCVIRGFTIDVAETEVPDIHARGFFQLRLRRPVCKLVHSSIAAWPELLGFWSLAGDLDVMVLVAAPTAADIDELRERLGRHPEIKALTTLLVLREWTNRGAPRG
jgi:Lrp/AsnC family leucine-responsive transcriptional regulator